MNRSLLAAALIPLVYLSAPALAQDTTVNLGGWWGFIRPLALRPDRLAMAAMIGALAKLAYSLLGINIEMHHRDARHSAVMTGVSSALEPDQGGYRRTTYDGRQAPANAACMRSRFNGDRLDLRAGRDFCRWLCCLRLRCHSAEPPVSDCIDSQLVCGVASWSCVRGGCSSSRAMPRSILTA